MHIQVSLFAPCWTHPSASCCVSCVAAGEAAAEGAGGEPESPRVRQSEGEPETDVLPQQRGEGGVERQTVNRGGGCPAVHRKPLRTRAGAGGVGARR